MHIRPLPTDETAVRQYVERLWLPYHRHLESVVDRHALSEPLDLDAEAAYWLDRLQESEQEIRVAVDADEADAEVLWADAGIAGFVTTDVDRAPPSFDRADRLLVGDIFVHESHRGTGLAERLVEAAAGRARAEDCTELVLDVDVDNERALAFYDALGFEPVRRRLARSVDGL